MDLFWMDAALEDIDAIHKYLAKFSLDGADRVRSSLVLRATSLTVFPYRGRIVPEFEHRGIREAIVGDYRMLYLVLPGRIEIHAVVHGARDLRLDD